MLSTFPRTTFWNSSKSFSPISRTLRPCHAPHLNRLPMSSTCSPNPTPKVFSRRTTTRISSISVRTVSLYSCACFFPFSSQSLPPTSPLKASGLLFLLEHFLLGAPQLICPSCIDFHLTQSDFFWVFQRLIRLFVVIKLPQREFSAIKFFFSPLP